jgi:hypothetical protein
MSIGGEDIILKAPADGAPGDLGDIILRACWRHWEYGDCHFEDADRPGAYSFREPWVWTVGTTSKEFFVYKDAAAAESWEQYGMTRANASAMLHFLIGGWEPTPPGIIEVTLVCDRQTRAIKTLVAQLRAMFENGVPRYNRMEAA